MPQAPPSLRSAMVCAGRLGKVIWTACIFPAASHIISNVILLRGLGLISCSKVPKKRRTRCGGNVPQFVMPVANLFRSIIFFSYVLCFGISYSKDWWQASLAESDFFENSFRLLVGSQNPSRGWIFISTVCARHGLEADAVNESLSFALTCCVWLRKQIRITLALTTGTATNPRSGPELL